ncbi:MAG: PAS domain-containing protein, partial [Pseudomonadota bacterium]
MAKTLPATADDTPDYAGALGARLLEQGMLLVFEVTQGGLVHANETAIFRLELPDDGLNAYGFQDLITLDKGDPGDLWFELMAGARSQFTAGVKCILSGSELVVDCLATLVGPDGDAQRVVVHCSEVEQATVIQEDDSAFAGLGDYVGLIEYDAEGKVRMANSRAEMALEFMGEDLVGRTHESLWPDHVTQHPDYVSFWEKLREGRIVEGAYRHQTADGGEVWLQSIYVPIRDTDGMMTCVKHCLMDVTDATRSANANERLLASLRSSLAFAEFDGEGHYLAASDAMTTLLGTKEGSMNGRAVKRFLDPEFFRSDAYTRAMDTIKTGRAVTTDVLHVRDDAKTVWTHSAFVPVLGEDDTIERVVELAFDVDEQYARYEELELRMEAVDSGFGMVEVSTAGKVLSANKRYLSDLGLAKEDVVGGDYASLVPNEVRQSNDYREFWETITAGTTLTNDVRRVGADGAEIWLRAHYAPLRRAADPRVRRIICLTSNITPDRLRDAEHTAKLSALESFMGVAEYTPDGQLHAASKSFLDLMGYQL